MPPEYQASVYLFFFLSLSISSFNLHLLLMLPEFISLHFIAVFIATWLPIFSSLSVVLKNDTLNLKATIKRTPPPPHTHTHETKRTNKWDVLTLNVLSVKLEYHCSRGGSAS